MGTKKTGLPNPEEVNWLLPSDWWEAEGSAVLPFETEFRRDERILRFSQLLWISTTLHTQNHAAISLTAKLSLNQKLLTTLQLKHNIKSYGRQESTLL